MIKPPATRFVAAVLIIGALVTAPELDRNDEDESSVLIAKPVIAPQFRVTLQPGTLTIRGHTATRQHERDLLRVASNAHEDSELTTEFESLGIVPAYWQNASTEALLLLAETTSATATMTANVVTILGISTDPAGWQGRVDRFQALLPPEVSLAVDVRFVDPGISVSAVCGRAFAAHETGPINFEESSADFRNSAYPRLARVVALAKACSDSQISIMGHTDSSGSETWNQRLSLLRATAVGDYLVRGGVNRSRLSVSGVGSTVPIADNGTRYGRSQNRRIEIALSSD